MKNDLTKRINKLKQLCYKKLIDGCNICNNDPKKIWSNVNEMIGRKKKQSIDEMCKKNFKSEDLKTVCNKFNKNFVQTVEKLGKMRDGNKYRECEGKRKNGNNKVGPPKHSMVVQEASIEEICNIVGGSKNTKATGIDGVVIKHLKEVNLTPHS